MRRAAASVSEIRNLYAGRLGVILGCGPGLLRREDRPAPRPAGDTLPQGVPARRMRLITRLPRRAVVIGTNVAWMARRCDWLASVHLENYEKAPAGKLIVIAGDTRDLDRFPFDRRLWALGGSLTYALSAAWHMGFAEIWLLGCDGYVDPRWATHFYGEPDVVVRDREIVWDPKTLSRTFKKASQRHAMLLRRLRDRKVRIVAWGPSWLAWDHPDALDEHRMAESAPWGPGPRPG